ALGFRLRQAAQATVSMPMPASTRHDGSGVAAALAGGTFTWASMLPSNWPNPAGGPGVGGHVRARKGAKVTVYRLDPRTIDWFVGFRKVVLTVEFCEMLFVLPARFCLVNFWEVW